MITKYYLYVTKLVFLTISDAELMLFPTYSEWVIATVLLHEAGNHGTHIKLRIRWLSDCFQTYLWNTYTIFAQHTTELGGDNDFNLKRLAFSEANVPKDQVYSGGIAETDMELDNEVWYCLLRKMRVVKNE